MKNITKFIPLILMALMFLPSFPAHAWLGDVVGITDGDTLTVLNSEKQQVKIRLAEIDAPEKSQDYGTQAKNGLSDLCYRQVASVDEVGKKTYGRTIAWVSCRGVDVNAELVKQGLAWTYKKYLTKLELAQHENGAIAKKLGLWSIPNPVPPWDYRNRKTLSSK